jgi:hypothetical protein
LPFIIYLIWADINACNIKLWKPNNFKDQHFDNVPDPNPDPHVLGLPDPDQLVKGMDIILPSSRKT